MYVYITVLYMFICIQETQRPPTTTEANTQEAQRPPTITEANNQETQRHATTTEANPEEAQRPPATTEANPEEAKGLLEELKQPRPWQQPRPDCPAYRHAGLQNTFHTDFFNHWKSTRALSVYPFSLLRQLGHLRSHLPQRQHLEGHHLGHLVDALHLLHQCHHCHPGHHLLLWRAAHQALRFLPYMSKRRPGTKPPASWTTPLKTKTHNNLTEQHNGTLILLASAGRLKLIRSSRSGLVGPLLQIVQVRVIEEAQLSLQGDQSASSTTNRSPPRLIIGDLPASSTPATANITKKDIKLRE